MQGILIKLFKIQQNLKCNKSKFNKFGNFNYRSCEDILESVKPLLANVECVIVPNDEVVEIGGRLFIKSTQTILDIVSGESYSASAMAELPNSANKKMDEPQCTGSASSYARKYALNGLFMLDDSELDSDTQDTTKTVKKEEKIVNTKQTQDVELNGRDLLVNYCKENHINMLELVNIYPELKQKPTNEIFLKILKNLKGEDKNGN